MNADPIPQDATVHVVCRYFASCQYQATGPSADVSANYKQHLREQHNVAHPKVEAGELQASGALADFDRSPAIMAALDPFPVKPWCGGEAVLQSFTEAYKRAQDDIAAAVGLPRPAMCQLEPGAEPRILDFQREGA